VLEIEVDRDAIARHGIPAHEVLQAIAALGTREVGVLQEGERRFPIAITLESRYRTDAGGVGRILVTGTNGDQVPLERLTRTRMTEGPSTINREWGKRRVVVQANVRGRDVGSFVSELKHALEDQVRSLPAITSVSAGSSSIWSGPERDS
jgi:cobalt-zinc-cadmium resistance protein CzcA